MRKHKNEHGAPYLFEGAPHLLEELKLTAHLTQYSLKFELSFAFKSR